MTTSYNNLTRFAYIDDSDASIVWEGDWAVSDEQHVLPDIGANYFGAPHGGSQHVTGTSGNMSYTFRGSALNLYGTNEMVSMTEGALDPLWRCFLDGEEVAAGEGWDGAAMNQWRLCTIAVPAGTADDEHVFRLEASADAGAVYVDYMAVHPSRTLWDSLHPTVLIESTDAAVTYPEGNWALYDEDVRVATERGAAMRLLFNGTKATWYGWLPGDYGSAGARATFAVDGAASVEFEIPGVPGGGDTTLYHVPLFETPTLPRGEHALDVVYGGAAMPLVLDYFLVEDGDLFVTDASARADQDGDESPVGGAPTPSPSPSPAPEPESKKTNVGAIAGGVVGGVVGLALILGLIFFLLKRRKRAAAPAPSAAYAAEHGHGELKGLYDPAAPLSPELSAAGYDVSLLHGHGHGAGGGYAAQHVTGDTAYSGSTALHSPERLEPLRMQPSFARDDRPQPPPGVPIV